jgi:hypothetical protein
MSSQHQLHVNYVFRSKCLVLSYVQHTSIEYGSSTLDGALRLLVSWIGFIQPCNEIADEALRAVPAAYTNVET